MKKRRASLQCSSAACGAVYPPHAQALTFAIPRSDTHVGIGRNFMLRFGVANLRRLKLVPPIELKPITILSDAIVAGEFFLRAFPLLRRLR